MVIIANGCGYTQGLFWLPWRIAPVGQENQIEDVRFLFSPSTTPPLWPPTRIQRCLCREVEEIWQCRTGRNLTTFDKDHGTAEEGLVSRNKVLAVKHMASLQLLRTAGGNQAKLDARNEFESRQRGGEAGRATDCTTTQESPKSLPVAFWFRKTQPTPPS